MLKNRGVYLVPEWQSTVVDNRFCSCFIKSVPICSLGEDRAEDELSTDHYLVVSWIRWQGSLLDSPGEHKYVTVNWEYLV